MADRAAAPAPSAGSELPYLVNEKGLVLTARHIQAELAKDIHLLNCGDTFNFKEGMPSSATLGDGRKIKLETKDGRITNIRLCGEHGQQLESYSLLRNGWTNSAGTPAFNDACYWVNYFAAGCLESGKLKGSEQLYRQLRDICRLEGTKEAASLLPGCHDMLGRLYLLQEKSSEALAEFRQAALLIEAAEGPNSKATLDYHHSVHDFLKMQGQPKLSAWHDECIQRIAAQRAYNSAFAAGDPLTKVVLLCSALPEHKIQLALGKDKFSFHCGPFDRLIDSFPGASLQTDLRDLLAGFQGVTVDDGRVTIHGQSSIMLPPGDMGEVMLTLDSPSFTVSKDPGKPGMLHLKNVRGLGVTYGPLSMEIRDIWISLTPEGRMRVLIGEPVMPSRRKSPATVEGNALGALQTAADISGGMADDIAFPIKLPIPPIELKLGRQNKPLLCIFTAFREYASAPKAQKDVHAILRSFLREAAPAELQFLENAKSIEIDRGVFTITMNAPAVIGTGNCSLKIAEKSSFKFNGDRRAPKFTDIQGISFCPPLPEKCKGVIQNAFGSAIPITELSITAPDNQGHRTISGKSSSRLKTFSVVVDKNLEPVSDASGLLQFSFEVDLTGAGSECVTLIEAALGGKIGSAEKKLLSGATRLTYSMGNVQLTRSTSSHISYGAICLGLDKTVSFKLSLAGNGVSITNISGVEAWVPLELPVDLKEIGIDPSDQLKAKLLELHVAPNANGSHQKLTIVTDHSVQKLAVTIDQNGRPVTDLTGRWALEVTSKNPLAPDKQLHFSLHFDKDNKPAMTLRESLTIVSKGAKDGIMLTPKGLGNKVISVAADGTLLLIDTVETAKGVAVDKIETIKENAKEKIETIKEIAIDKADSLKKFTERKAEKIVDVLDQGWKFLNK